MLRKGQCDLVESGFGLSAHGVAAGTMYVITKLGIDESGVFNDDFVKALREKIELFAADGAYDEQLAGALRQKSRVSVKI
jgi:hypothetical protein